MMSQEEISKYNTKYYFEMALYDFFLFGFPMGLCLVSGIGNIAMGNYEYVTRFIAGILYLFLYTCYYKSNTVNAKPL